MAQYCPQLGQLFAFARHKMMRREKIFGRSTIAIRNMLSDCRKRGFARKNLTLDFTLHPSPFRRNPLCLSAFQEVKGGTNPSPTLHPPFTLYPPVFICNCILTFSFLSQESKILPCQGQHFAPIRHKTKRRDRKKYTTGRLFFSSKRISAFSEGTDRKP